MIDSWEIWDNYKPFALRPLVDRPVWIGYDPSHTCDNAGCVVVSPPMFEGGENLE